MLQSRYLVDTNILLRLTNRRREQYEICHDAIRLLRSSGCLLYYTLQNAAEFWNVSTRPVEWNGQGLSVEEVGQGLNVIEGSMTLLPDDAKVYATWRELIAALDVRGVQVHDAKLAAAMLAHDVPRILQRRGLRTLS
jgi:predicted nucleic acid-binding protein